METPAHPTPDTVERIEFDIYTAKILQSDFRTPRLYKEFKEVIEQFETAKKSKSLGEDLSAIKQRLDNAFSHWKNIHQDPSTWAKLLTDATLLREILLRRLLFQYLPWHEFEPYATLKPEAAALHIAVKEQGMSRISQAVFELGIDLSVVERHFTGPQGSIGDLVKRRDFSSLGAAIRDDRRLAEALLDDWNPSSASPPGEVFRNVLHAIDSMEQRWGGEICRAKDSSDTTFPGSPTSSRPRFMFTMTSWVETWTRERGMKLRRWIRSGDMTQ